MGKGEISSDTSIDFCKPLLPVLHLFWFSISLDSRERERERKRACSLLNRGPRLFLVGTERLATCRVPRLNNASVTWSIRPASSVVNHLEEERVLLLVDDATVDSPHPPEPPVSLVITAINPRGEISCLSTDFLMVVVACER